MRNDRHSEPDDARLRAIATALLRHYDAHARDLPWRTRRDAYAVWLSEIMLQQTRVDTVIPYFGRFLARFPTLETLADAPIDDVLKAWSGLGYYRRARTLHLAAKEVTTRYAGVIPDAVDELRTLPGIGRYTAGAIASIAYGRNAPLVDGNVSRVLARLEASRLVVGSTEGDKFAWRMAEALVAESPRPGDLNQSLMELGATVCVPRNPTCGLCPLAERCRANAEGSVDELPRMKVKKPPERVKLVAYVVRRRDAVLLGQRERDGLFGGMWEPPMTDAAIAGLSVAEAVGRVEHVLTHRIMEIDVVRGSLATSNRVPAPFPPYVSLAFRAPSDVALSSLAQKVLRAGEPAVSKSRAASKVAPASKSRAKPAERRP